MELIRYWRTLRRWSRLIVLLPLLAGTAAAIASMLLPPVYEAQVSVLVRPAQPLAVDVGAAALTSDQISRTYATLMTERPLLETVSADLALNESPDALSRQIRVTPQVNTTILTVAVDDVSPRRARDIANTLVTDFINEVKSIQQQENANPNSATHDNLVVVSPAVIPGSPISPNIRVNIAVAIFGGLLLAVGTAFLFEYLDQSIKTDEDLADRVGLVAIAHIPFAPAPKQRRAELVSLLKDHATAEAYRSFRTSLLFSAVDRELKTIVVTSAFPGEGKTRTAANLASVLAEAGHKTLLIDADFRRPSLHRLFGIVANYGVADLILRDRSEADLVIAVDGVPNLWLIAAGTRPPNPSELLGSDRMHEIIDRFRQHFTYVILDTPPVMAVTDALLLSAHADATVLVVEQGRTAIPALIQTKAAIGRVGGRIVGVVMNKLHAERHGYDYYSRNYNYSYGADSDDSASGGRKAGRRRGAPVKTS